MELTRGICPASIVTQKNARLDMGFSDMHDSIARLATWCHFDAGHILYLEGEPAEALYILERGWVRATRMSLDGVEARVANMRKLPTGGWPCAARRGRPSMRWRPAWGRCVMCSVVS